jgi:hypothetical protein
MSGPWSPVDAVYADCFWSGCWAPPGIRALGVSYWWRRCRRLQKLGLPGCCEWPASRFCPLVTNKKIKYIRCFSCLQASGGLVTEVPTPDGLKHVL